MKKLLKHISPLAPDDSGACSVLYELGGITVICDAGGCAGNVCGFDEPRWFTKPSALFSAGLRDMDAILGRDDRLVEKLTKVCSQVDARFTAIIGTPVPAVIATDYKALRRMSEKRTGLPCITVNSDGTELYDKGEEKAYYELFDRFAVEKKEIIPRSVGVIGATPLNTGLTTAESIINALSGEYDRITCFGLDSGLDEIINASQFEEIMVIAPSGERAARLMEERFGTRVRYGYPCLPEETLRAARELKDKKILVVHEQMAANALREEIRGCEVVCASWFGMEEKLCEAGDKKIASEEELEELIAGGGFDAVIADEFFRRAVRGWKGEWIDFPHYAVSGIEARN
ncbi:MAG: hypothetical protein IJ737_07635 [Ruminococcus sp.]|nr:hypothetical protein [Ruminococcus sp.]